MNDVSGLFLSKAWLQNFKACSTCIMSECLFIHGWFMSLVLKKE